MGITHLYDYSFISIGTLPLSIMSQADGLVLYSSIGTLSLSPLSQADGLSWQAASLRHPNLGQRPKAKDSALTSLQIL